MIEKLTVNSFKSLESVEVDLGQVNVFIGANGSGKSNLLEAPGRPVSRRPRKSQ